jgi:hypothetical protein
MAVDPLGDGVFEDTDQVAGLNEPPSSENSSLESSPQHWADKADLRQSNAISCLRVQGLQALQCPNLAAATMHSYRVRVA